MHRQVGDCAFGGSAALIFFMTGRKELQAGQPYENTSMTSTLPAGTLERWVGMTA